MFERNEDDNIFAHKRSIEINPIFVQLNKHSTFYFLKWTFPLLSEQYFFFLSKWSYCLRIGALFSGKRALTYFDSVAARHTKMEIKWRVMSIYGWLFTLYNSIWCLNWRQVGYNSDIIIPVGIFYVNCNRFFHFSVETGNNTSWTGYIGQAAFVIVTKM